MSRRPLSRAESDVFRLGVNYWPARTAMGFWRGFDVAEVGRDFARIYGAGFESVRIFLRWEDFQPSGKQVDPTMLDRLVATMDEASGAGLCVMPTLFVGHMSGANWIPEWATGIGEGDARFRVVSGNRVLESSPLNWYTEPTILEAQASLAAQVARTLQGHDALWAWDLGNENSNCTLPPDRASARAWLLRMSDALRGSGQDTPITIGLHMEDLENDRRLGPSEASEVCDFLTMHGYPGYAAWASGPTDERILPFLSRVTCWLGGNVPVLFAEFGVPTTAPLRTMRDADSAAEAPQLVSEQEAAAYVERALVALLEAGSTGAMLWCYSDYEEATWATPPLDLAEHERFFGLWHADASPKAAVAIVKTFAGREHQIRMTSAVRDESWLDLDASAFYEAPKGELERLYGRYCRVVARSSP